MNKRRMRGSLLVLAGLIMILAAMALQIIEEKRDALAGENARILLRQLALERTSIEDGPEETTPAQTNGTDFSMAVKSYLGYSMIGTLRISSVGIELPVLSAWSYELLDVAPCRDSGSAAGGDLIIMGHNYKSHFTPLHDIAVGAEVEFEDVHGSEYRYIVERIEYLHRGEGEQLPSDYELTLFTCTSGGAKRIVVRCRQSG